LKKNQHNIDRAPASHKRKYDRLEDVEYLGRRIWGCTSGGNGGMVTAIKYEGLKPKGKQGAQKSEKRPTIVSVSAV
jgi:hypothetical protein